MIRQQGIPPIWIGAAVSVSIFCVYVAVEYARGHVELVVAGEDDHLAMHFRITAINAALIGYMLAARRYLARWTEQHLADLTPLLTGEVPRRIPPYATAMNRRVGAICAFTLVLLFLVLPNRTLPLTAAYWTLEHVWDWVVLPVIGWMTGRLGHAIVRDAQHFSLLSSLLEIDLFDRERYQPFVHQGLRSALLALLYMGIGAGLATAAAVNDVAGVLSMFAMAAIGTVALLLPVRGLHRQIVAEKRARLARVHDEVRRGERDALGSGEASARARAGMPGMLALEARIQAVREWPFDASSIARFGFYLMIGFGSWLGAAAVERLLDSILD